MKLEYVASGCTYSRIPTLSARPEKIQQAVTYLLDQKGSHNHDFSMLFNGYTEVKLGETIHSCLDGYLSKIHADSGGLQIMTLGKENTPAIRDKVYFTQGKFSDLAMSFDEIFMVNESFGASARTDINTKTVITGDAYKYGQLTGENIKRQLDVLLRMKSKSRPAMILHGNHFDDFENYYNGMCDTLPEEYIKELACSAVSDTCIGNGVLEGADMVSMLQRLDLPDNLRKNCHLLGVGSFSRLLPTIMMWRGGYLDKDLHVSYDSTTHTSKWTKGEYTIYGKLSQEDIEFLTSDGSKATKRVKGGFTVDDDFNTANIYIAPTDTEGQRWLATRIYNKYSELIDIPKDEFVMVAMEATIRSSMITERFDREGNEDHKFYANYYYLLWTLDLIEGFMNLVNHALECSDEELDRAFSGSMSRLQPLKYLQKVKTASDYVDWRNDMASQLSSKRIKRDIAASKTTVTSDARDADVTGKDDQVAAAKKARKDYEKKSKTVELTSFFG